MYVSVNWISLLALQCEMFYFSCITVLLLHYICNIKRKNNSRNTLTLEQNLNKKIFFVLNMCVNTVCTVFLSTRWGAAMTVYVPQKSSIYT